MLTLERAKELHDSQVTEEHLILHAKNVMYAMGAIALIARGYPSSASRTGDGLIRFFREFLEQNAAAKAMYRRMELPLITEEIIDDCFTEVPLEIDRAFVREFILNGQRVVAELINT